MAIVGYWRMNGNSNDASGNGNNGADTNMSYSIYYGNYAAIFNSDSDRIYVSISNNYQFTFSFSFYLTSYTFGSSPYASYFFNNVINEHPTYNNTKSNYGVVITNVRGDNNIRFNSYAGSLNDRLLDGNISIQLNKWYHVVAISNGSSSYIIVNGKIDAYGELNQLPKGEKLYIGGNVPTIPDSGLPGYMDELKFDGLNWSLAKAKNEYARVKGFF